MHFRRSGFTLVEMMVAMTLTVFVMVILSECFVAGLETFSTLKAIGDMTEELRTASNLLRSDLKHDHFEGRRRLSDPAFKLMTEKMQEGFFAIGQGYPFRTSNIVLEGDEGEGIINGIRPFKSFRVTDHW